MTHIFYIPDIKGDDIFLDETESKHAIKVLRLGAGDLVSVTDGKGGFYTARVQEANPRKCKLVITETRKETLNRDCSLHIAIAPTKNLERYEWFIEKATEIGIDEITPVITAHSERKTLKPERLQKIAVSAIKQSQKAFLPVIHDAVPFDQLIRSVSAGKKFIAHCHEGEKVHLKDETLKDKHVFILIGPEGDFSKAEVDQAVQSGFTEVTLGNSRLRTETAGIVACHIFTLANE